MYIAKELGKSLEELADMPFNEVMLWFGYFTVKAEYEEQERDRANARRKVTRR